MLVVESVRDADVDPVARLALRTLQERYDPEWLAAQTQRRGSFLVARDIPTNQVVGFALAQRDTPEAHLLAIAVDKGRQGEGIGSALLKNVRQELARSGAMKLRLEVRADDTWAQTFYQRHGFSATGLQTNVYSDGGDAITMTRPL